MTPEELEEYKKKRASEKGAGGGKKRDPSKWAHEKLGDDSDDDADEKDWTAGMGDVDEEDLRDLYEEKAELQEATRDDINAQAQLTETKAKLTAGTIKLRNANSQLVVALKTLQDGQEEEIEEVQEEHATAASKMNKAVINTMMGERGNVVQNDKEKTTLKKSNKHRKLNTQAMLDQFLTA